MGKASIYSEINECKVRIEPKKDYTPCWFGFLVLVQGANDALNLGAGLPIRSAAGETGAETQR